MNQIAVAPVNAIPVLDDVTAFAFRKVHRSGYITKYGSKTINSSDSSKIAEYVRNIPPVTPEDISVASNGET